jgi:ech hydrogenase subunit E
VRVDAPYAAYPGLQPRSITAEQGDLEARFVVRLEELFESYRMIRALLADLPEGELTTRMPRRIKEGETISRVEAPRGELFYFIKSNGTDTPERIRVRTPTICNLASVVKLAVGHQLADVPMILAGIDPCFSCNDRMVMLADGRQEPEVWTWEKLRQYGINTYRERID